MYQNHKIIRMSIFLSTKKKCVKLCTVIAEAIELFKKIQPNVHINTSEIRINPTTGPDQKFVKKSRRLSNVQQVRLFQEQTICQAWVQFLKR